MYFSISQNGRLMQYEEYFPGTSMRANDGVSHEGMSRRGSKKSRLIFHGARRRNTTSPSWSRLLVAVLSHELSLTTDEREASRVIKNTKESEKEQKYEVITPGESRYYWKLLTQWKWAIGVAGGPRGSLLLLFSTLPVAPIPRALPACRSETPCRSINTRQLWTLAPSFCQMKSRNTHNYCRTIADRRQMRHTWQWWNLNI